MDNPDFSEFDSPEHDAAQALCWHFVNHAINAETKREAWARLEYARSVGDPVLTTTALAQMSGPCEHRLPPKQDAASE